MRSILYMSVYSIAIIVLTAVIHYYTATAILSVVNVHPLLYVLVLAIIISVAFYYAAHNLLDYKYVDVNSIISTEKRNSLNSFMRKVFNKHGKLFEVVYDSNISDDNLYNEAEKLAKIFKSSKHIDMNGQLYKEDVTYAESTTSSSTTIISFPNTLDPKELATFITKVKGRIIFCENSKVKGLPLRSRIVSVYYKWLYDLLGLEHKNVDDKPDSRERKNKP